MSDVKMPPDGPSQPSRRERVRAATRAEILLAARDLLVAGRDGDPSAKLKQRFLATSYAFRVWALEHRPEFGLLFGAPIPGVLIDNAGNLDPATNRGMRFGQVWLELFAELW